MHHHIIVCFTERASCQLAAGWYFGSFFQCVRIVIVLRELARIRKGEKAVKPLPSFRKDHIDSITACSVLASSLYEMAGGADRLNCVFRDDLTFLVYLWQRWKYRVDETRMMEK